MTLTSILNSLVPLSWSEPPGSPLPLQVLTATTVITINQEYADPGQETCLLGATQSYTHQHNHDGSLYGAQGGFVSTSLCPFSFLFLTLASDFLPNPFFGLFPSVLFGRFFESLPLMLLKNRNRRRGKTKGKPKRASPSFSHSTTRHPYAQQVIGNNLPPSTRPR